MTVRAIMLMGTGSDVGKSLIATGLCRALSNRGLRIQPFKPQNMSNNAAVTNDGGEIGRAQALQARAARVPPTVHMNPVLLKPESERGAQLIVQGRRHATMMARDFFAKRSQFLPAILESFRLISQNTDLVLVEGAGSPAEINLRDGDLANMGFATAADVPAVLIGDIHRGGVIASIIGTLSVLCDGDRRRIKGFLINKFHGDLALFDEGREFLIQKTGLPCLGIVPHFSAAARLPAEDVLGLPQLPPTPSKNCRICVMRLPRIANFDDFDPLQLESGVTVQFLGAGDPIPGDAKLVIIPGSKSTMADLSALRREGWDVDLAAHVRRGGYLLGLCGGYQMLGRLIHDPEGLEGPAGSIAGLGLLDVETTLLPDKAVTEVSGVHAASGAAIMGYEIHLGQTAGADCSRPFALIGSRPDGAVGVTGRVMGTYLHGCFASDEFRRHFLTVLGAQPTDFSFDIEIERTLDELAAHLENHLDIDRLLAIARPV